MTNNAQVKVPIPDPLIRLQTSQPLRDSMMINYANTSMPVSRDLHQVSCNISIVDSFYKRKINSFSLQYDLTQALIWSSMGKSFSLTHVMRAGFYLA